MDDDWGERLRIVGAEVDAALKPPASKFGAEAIKQAIESHGWTEWKRRSGKKAGRPREYGDAELSCIWLFVKHGIATTHLSANKFCKRNSYSWTDRDGKTKTISGETLRRRYQQSEKLLKEERERERYAGPVAAAVIPSMRRLWEQALAIRLGAATCAEIDDVSRPLFPHKQPVLRCGSPSRKGTHDGKEREASDGSDFSGCSGSANTTT